MKYLLFILALAGVWFLWWAFSPLLFNNVVDEPLPVSTSSSEELQPENTDKAATGIDSSLNTPGATLETTPKATESLPKASSIVGTPGHSASGEIRLISGADGTNTIRFENYKGTNGPDLFVYLSKDKDASEFINLGEAKGNQGNINYPIPAGVNPEDYPYVLTWCKAFGVLFDYAKVN